ncbi:MAG: type III pantothenate kinase [Gammaproteobacteria bacterium]|nr:type III pantothenate kinase [Gammaproteobacteria bacterium]
MNLLLDIGNTRVKWAQWQGGRLHAGGALSHEAFLEALASATIAKPEAVHIACVGGTELRASFDAAISACWGLRASWAAPHAEFGGLRNAYAEPERLGVDRWLAMLAGRHRVGGAVLVVDAGSALTLDCVDAHGQHRGGLIVPGLGMARRSLFSDTGQVRFPLARPCAPEHEGAWGRDTEQAVKFGVLWNAVGLVEYMAKQAAEALGSPPACLLTGGDGAQLGPWLRIAHTPCADLVLEGLCLQAGWELVI